MIESVTTLSTSLTQATPLSSAAGSDVERFRQALLSSASTTTSHSAVPAQLNASTNPEGVLTPGAVAPPSSNTLGEAILNTLQTASTQMQQSWQQAAEVVAGKDINELLGKGISKSTQNLEQILKTQ